ncbi:hypothetical protein [Flectobacillus longus]|uniref:hypothetical protein n=1 Tax=Flectobacillus longus TaxID=2984207 RepID=UPI0024B6B3E0|nr:hypothetical protein [Flectobacillus longus]MDI9878925.1 hypothetical protein [Flectobacillus longus]
MKTTATPKRLNGNFLWTVYINAPRYKQVEFKEKLIELSGGNEQTLWQSFNRVQTIETKNDNFNSEIVGLMVQTFCEDTIKMKYTLTDVEKIREKAKQIESTKSQINLFSTL